MERTSTSSVGPLPGGTVPAGTLDARPRTLLERDDVAFVPRIAFVFVSLATIVSVLLRPGDRDVDQPLIVWSALLVAGAALTFLTPFRPLAARAAGRAGSYAAAGVVMALALGAISWFDGGASGPFFTTTVAVTTFLGLVLPRGPAYLTLLPLLLVTVGLELHAPPGTLLNAATVPMLMLAGFGLGRAGHRFHARAARRALVRSRTDALTTMLNRRGFFEQFEHQLAAARAAVHPFSVLLIDLNGFKQVNDEHGHAAGDELLAWVGTQLAQRLPADATAGRLGGDEFAVLLPQGGELPARHLADGLRAALAPRIGAAIGTATSVPGDTAGPDALLRIADARMYAQKRGTSVELPEAHVRAEAAEAAFAPREAPPVAYADVRSAGAGRRGDARIRPIDLFGALTIVVSGIVIAALQLAYPGETGHDRLLMAVAGPWVVANLAVIGLMLHPRVNASRRAGEVLYLVTATLLGGALTIAMLAGPGAGLASPIVAAFFLKVSYDGFAAGMRLSRLSAMIMGGWWVVAAVAGPADALWLVPFQLSMLVAARAIGVLSRRAFAETTRRITLLAHADPLTGLANRAGFEAALRPALAAAEEGRPLALLAVDLDGFKQINDELGHEAGDELLRGVAAVLRERLTDAYAIARVGGDEFAAAVPAGSAREAEAIADALCGALAEVVRGSVGWSVYGADGTTPEALAKVADGRSYAIKRERRTGGGGGGGSQRAAGIDRLFGQPPAGPAIA